MLAQICPENYRQDYQDQDQGNEYQGPVGKPHINSFSRA